jgi:hypothetical protein
MHRRGTREIQPLEVKKMVKTIWSSFGDGVGGNLDVLRVLLTHPRLPEPKPIYGTSVHALHRQGLRQGRRMGMLDVMD